jgi:hypothetical protein
MATKRSGQATGTKKSAALAAAKQTSVRKTAAAHIKAAPKGPRTVSHGRIKKAVEKVFRERSAVDA